MARVFVSHASEDRALAGELHGWLVEAGHEVFLDQDLRDGIALGEEWERRLHEQLRWANAVVCVVTSAYLNSMWCAVEIGIARSRGSQLLPLCAEPDAVHPLLTSLQHVDYTADLPAARAAVLQALRQVDTAWPDDRSPFPGLRPFDTDQHRVFFGRADEVGQLAELLRSAAERAEGAALLVVGPSGCGKSSLVRAGLLPVMADQPGWRTLPPILPGTDPVAALVRELAAAARRIALDWTVNHVHHQLNQRGLTGLADELLLADPAGPQQRLLIVVDQFEELLTQTAPTERARFIELLRPALTGPVRVVATLRPEFLDQLLVDPELTALPTRTYTLRPLRREALRTVIEKPAQLAGIVVDDGLVDRLVDDTDNGEALPLLAFTLAQLAEGVTRGGRLSSARYDQLGGVQGALTRQADAALTHAVTAGGRSREQVIAGLLRLVTVDEQGRPTRWRVRRDELPTPVITELDVFVERRLLTTDEGNGSGVVGVAHEAFLSAWSPLAEAIAANVTALRARRMVEPAATEWHDDGKPSTRLWTGGQLAASVTALTDMPLRPGGFARWVPRRQRVLTTERVDLSAKAREFLQASIRRDRFQRRRTQFGLSVLSIIALIGAGVAVVRQHDAQRELRIAIASQLIAQSDAVRSTDPRTALRLEIAAQRLDPGGKTVARLVNTLMTTHYLGTLTGHTNSVSSVAFAPDGRTLATGSYDNTVILWDVRDPARPRRFGHPLTGHTDGVSSVAFTLDGHTLATGSSDKTVILWDVRDPAHPGRLGQPLTETGVVGSVSFAPDGRTLATVGLEDTSLWDVSDPARPRRLGQPLTGYGPVESVMFSPDGRTLATTGFDYSDSAFGTNVVILWDVHDPAHPSRLGQPLIGHTAPVESVAFAPDGRTLATGSFDRTVILWDVRDSARPSRLGQPLTDRISSVLSVAFAPDGRTLATGSVDGTATLWDVGGPVSSGRLGHPLTARTNPVWAVAFTPDGHTLATGSLDGTATLWDVSDPVHPSRLGPPLTGHTGPVASIAFAPDGRTLATAARLNENAVVLWDLTDPTQPARLGQLPAGRVSSVMFSPDRDNPDPVRVSDLTIGVVSVMFAPDGRSLATGSNDGSVILWDLAGLNNLRNHAVERACAITRGGLDHDEWNRYIPGLPYQDTCPA